jgi:CheY-like chemotaxis protein
VRSCADGWILSDMSDSATSVDRPYVILVVDDDAGDVLLVREAFAGKRIPHQLHTAVDGVDALEFLREPGRPRPDLVVLDLNMPRMNGREFLAEVKADPLLRSIPIVVLSTSVTDEDVVSSYELRANAYLTKPVDLDEFTATVHTINDFYLGLVRLPHRAA